MNQAQLNAKWQKLCEEIAREAKRLGAREPFVFACEAGLIVLDGPPFDNNGASRPDAQLFKLDKPPLAVIAFDAGGY